MGEPLAGRRGNPCNGCPDRYTACSDHCRKPEFLKWKAEGELILENRRKYHAVTNYTVTAILRNRRKHK